MPCSSTCCFLTPEASLWPSVPVPVPHPNPCLLLSLIACSGALSTVEDLERNDGSAERPYFMSSTLKKLLNKTNKKVAES